jgi:hypothetical protein
MLTIRERVRIWRRRYWIYAVALGLVALVYVAFTS